MQGATHSIAGRSSNGHSNVGPSDTTTMKQLGIVVLALVGVTLGLIIAVTIIT